MAAVALADALKDFGAPRGGAKQPLAFNFGDDIPQPVVELPEPEPVISPEEELEQAVEHAKALLADKLVADHASDIASMEARHQAELERVQRECGADAALIIEKRLAEIETATARLASASAARILGVVLTGELQKQALRQLDDALKGALGTREAVSIRVSGPLSLFEGMRGSLIQYGDQVDFTETASFDLSVAIGDTIYQTRLADWSKALSEILE